MSNQEQSGTQKAMQAAQYIKGAAVTASKALAGDLVGAAFEAAKSFGPQIIKAAVILLVVTLLIPVIIISALPQVMYKWSTIPYPDLTEIKDRADQLIDAYKGISAERQNQLNALIAGQPISAIEGDPTEVIWLVAIDAVRHQQDVMSMTPTSVFDLIAKTFALITNRDENGNPISVNVKNKSPAEIMDELGFSDEQKNWAELMVTTIKKAQESGSIDPEGPNFPDPFRPGGAPAEAYNDETVKNLLAEGEKYLDLPYVYGGSSPPTFDCSGFICWVYTHSGVYNLPRTTAQGIYNQCAPVSREEAKPGDLIFFQGTYNHYETITHVGIYVGSGQMLHCGSPIQYTSCETAYWQKHFYGYGRLGGS